ncbi:MAG: cyclic nucleotide-binding domain-containing protein [Candidatus Dormibacteraeota bacterium]|nr:cyclic nucleotide-binding domain-containing protein [Candidatus Dormibacteraeota bacterium]
MTTALGAGQVTAAGRGQAGALPLTLAEIKNRYATLEHAPTLFTLPASSLRALARRSRVQHLAAGSTLFQQGDSGEAMYVVASGRCELLVVRPGGSAVTVAMAGPGDGLGEEGALLAEPRAATARAVVDSELIVLDREALAAVLVSDSEEAQELLRLAQQRRTSTWLLAGWSDRMGAAEQTRSVAVYAPKGGSGGTTVTLNLAAQLGRVHPGEVVVVDLSLPFNDLALIANLVPTGALALPGVLHPEQAELVNAELVERAVEVLRRSFRFVLFDLAPQLSSPTLAVLEGADNVLLLGSADLSSLKDLKEAIRVLEEVLRVPRSRVMVALNQRTSRGVVSGASAEAALGRPLVCEFQYEGPKLDEAAVRGEILSLSEPRGSMARATTQIASALDPQGPPPGRPPAAEGGIRGVG